MKNKSKKMKQLLVFVVATILLSCGGSNPGGKPNVEENASTPEVKKDKKVDLSDLLSTAEITSLTQNIAGNEVAAKGKPVKLTQQVTVAAVSAMTLTNNGGGSFSINYGDAPNVVTMFFRGGESLSVSGNVFPTAGLQYAPSFTTWTATFTTTYYQSLVVTGSTTKDENGVLGTDWVFTYTNVVQ